MVSMDQVETSVQESTVEPHYKIQCVKDSPKNKHENNIETVPVDWLGLSLHKTSIKDAKPDLPQDTKTPPKLPKDLSGTLFQQFDEAYPLETNTLRKGCSGGYAKRNGEMKEVILHPQSSLWDVPTHRLRAISKGDPTEYLALLDPQNTITTTKAIHRWEAERRELPDGGLNALPPKKSSSGFDRNNGSHVPIIEQRDFHSLYKTSYCQKPPSPFMEGLTVPNRDVSLMYPAYSGTTSMRGSTSSYVREVPPILKSTNKQLWTVKKIVI